MMVTPESFRLHLGVLKQYFEMVSYPQWLECKQKGENLPQKSCAITFDDGWADNYEFAYPLLKEFSVPATIYLVSDMVGTNQSFWPERLSNLLITIAQTKAQHWSNTSLSWILNANTSYHFDKNIPTQEEFAQIISHVKHMTDQEIHSRLDQIERELKIQPATSKPDLLNWEQISEMINSGLVEIGSHTCMHTRLKEGMPEQTLENEIVKSKHTIEKHTGKPVRTFCYPNGDYTQLALKYVRSHYTSAVTTKSGWNTASSDDHLLHRIAIHEDITNDKTAFLARISGWM